jgi:hypothetical protein
MLTDYIEEPHTAICGNVKGLTLDLTSSLSSEARKISLDLVNDNPQHIKNYCDKQTTLMNFNLPRSHEIPEMNKRNMLTLQHAYEVQPKTYEELISIRGMGPKTIRALALISTLIYGAQLSWKDPAKYSFAHGGKDGIPYPVDRALIDQSTRVLKGALEDSQIGANEKINALKRLKLKLN